MTVVILTAIILALVTISVAGIIAFLVKKTNDACTGPVRLDEEDKEKKSNDRI